VVGSIQRAPHGGPYTTDNVVKIEENARPFFLFSARNRITLIRNE
jgi:hypothetical protein